MRRHGPARDSSEMLPSWRGTPNLTVTNQARGQATGASKLVEMEGGGKRVLSNAAGSWEALGTLLDAGGRDDELLPYFPHCDPEAAIFAASPAAVGARARCGASGAPTAAAAPADRRDPWHLDVVMCESCERTVLRSAFAAHSAICVETTDDLDDILHRGSPGFVAQPGAGVSLGGRKADPKHVVKKKQKLLGKAVNPAGPGTGVGRGSGGCGGERGVGVAGRGIGGKGGRATAAAQAAAGPDPHAADRLRRSETAMLRARWISLVSLLKAPPEPPAPLVERAAVHRQLRPRARVVPLPALAEGTQPAAAAQRTQPPLALPARR
ncbi:hypothetical protein T492DRAFT_1145122 [Pavlovales sp. CCMP2436]|nr:hypothetical protein T492DRAFT_1145122 [Pavlovales sp. CCMP2436]